GRERRCIEFALLVGIAVYPVFDLTENHFHEDGRGAGPAAPDTAENTSKKHNEYDKRKPSQDAQVKILGHEQNTEDDELALEDVKKYGLFAVYLDKRRQKEWDQQQVANQAPVLV